MMRAELNSVQSRQLMKEKELRSIMIKNIRVDSANWVARARAKKQNETMQECRSDEYLTTCWPVFAGATGIAARLEMYEIREKGRAKLCKQQVDLLSHGYSNM